MSSEFSGEISHRGIVNTPECDENGHMNVQFYWARFANADAQFRLIQGLDDVAETDFKRISRHVRYHAELHGAHGLHILSRFAIDHTDRLHVLHQMIASDRAVVSATALDRISLSPTLEAAIRARVPLEMIPANALPRSLTRPDSLFPQSEADWVANGASLTCRAMIEPQLTDRNGNLSDRGFVGLSVEAAPATWSLGGFQQDALAERGLGRVALEKRLVIHQRPKSGDLVHIRSRIVAAERVTFSARHHYYDSRTGLFFASVDVTLLPMDLTLRKGVALPDDVRSRMQELARGLTGSNPD